MYQIKEQIIKLTQQALDDLVELVQDLKPEELTLSPSPGVRNIASQLQEIARTDAIMLPIIKDPYATPNHGGILSIEESEVTAGGLVRSMRTSVSAYCNALRSLPIQQLDIELPSPFRTGQTATFLDIAFMPYWNIVYHTGQVQLILNLNRAQATG